MDTTNNIDFVYVSFMNTNSKIIKFTFESSSFCQTNVVFQKKFESYFFLQINEEKKKLR